MSRTRYIDFFFDKPTVAQSEHMIGETCSTLYLLRREIEQCLIGRGLSSDQYVQESEDIVDSGRCIQFSSAMVIFSGIDLLAKLHAGEDASSGVKRKFVNFLTNMCGMSQNDADRAYKIRNSLMHSFGFYTLDTSSSKKLRLQRQGLLTECSSPGTCSAILKISRTWFVCIPHLYGEFLRAIDKYQDSLTGKGSREPRKRFTRMFWRYGFLTVGW